MRTQGFHVAFGGTWAMDLNTEPGCGKTMEPDMVLSRSLGSDVTIIPVGSLSHSEFYGPHGSMTLAH